MLRKFLLLITIKETTGMMNSPIGSAYQDIGEGVPIHPQKKTKEKKSCCLIRCFRCLFCCKKKSKPVPQVLNEENPPIDKNMELKDMKNNRTTLPEVPAELLNVDTLIDKDDLNRFYDQFYSESANNNGLSHSSSSTSLDVNSHRNQEEDNKEENNARMMKRLEAQLNLLKENMKKTSSSRSAHQINNG